MGATTKKLEEVEGMLNRAIDLLEGEDRAIKALERRCEKLDEQNEQLFDRLMARDFETYATRPQVTDVVATSRELALDEDEDNAGLALEIPDDSQK